ncbi:hypothetical protein BHE74_00052706 [Ensete ventricosum]|nr:hypothetical protein BHE74_00052706 [Ensete ventricosum]RZS25030.1 hypothetical protein BHM03_00058186 [Ensete ventricosum]
MGGPFSPPLFVSFGPMAKLFWLEAVLPLGIIAGMLCVMGNAQYYIHRAAHGRVHRHKINPFHLCLAETSGKWDELQEVWLSHFSEGNL